MEPISTMLVVASAAVGTGAFILHAYRRHRRQSDVLEDRNPAFEEDVSIAALRRDPEGCKSRIGDKVARVHTTSVSRSDGEGMTTTFNSYLLDINGEAHDIEHDFSQAQVEENARWVANLFDVEYEPL